MIVNTKKIKADLKKLQSVKTDVLTFDAERGIISVASDIVSARVTDSSYVGDAGVKHVSFTKFSAFVNRAKDQITLKEDNGGLHLLSNRLSVVLPGISGSIRVC